MQIDAKKGDLRIVKTEKALNAAMVTLLKRNDFGKITVRDICEEAQISRATFYARFADKYDFLKSWLKILKPEGIDINDDYENTQKQLNDIIQSNKTAIKNLICDADDETLGILSEFALSVINLSNEYDDRQMNPSQIVLYNFYAGGLICYFQWLAKNKFPLEIEPVNVCLLEIVEQFMEWARCAI